MSRFLFTLPNSTRIVLNYTPARCGIPEAVIVSYMSGGPVVQSTINKYRGVLNKVITIVREIEDGRAVLVGSDFAPGLITMNGVYDRAPHYLRRWGGEGKER